MTQKQGTNVQSTPRSRSSGRLLLQTLCLLRRTQVTAYAETPAASRRKLSSSSHSRPSATYSWPLLQPMVGQSVYSCSRSTSRRGCSGPLSCGMFGCASKQTSSPINCSPTWQFSSYLRQMAPARSPRGKAQRGRSTSDSPREGSWRCADNEKSYLKHHRQRTA